MDAGLYELLFTQKRTSFSQFSSQGSSVTLYVPFGGTMSYVPLATHSTQKEMEIKLGLESVLEERKPYSNRHLRKWPV